MTPEQDRRVGELYDRIGGLPANRHSQILAELCPDDPDVRDAVESMLRGALQTAAPGDGDTIKAKVHGAFQGLLGAGPTGDTLLGTSIGPYRILEKLGDGGMGSVYKAEQRSPIKRTVAMKIIKAGFDTKEVVARFEAERQALARMDHPNIAKVLDGGSTTQGRPYFVMEYVAGSPITRFADENKLSISDRLALFTQACEAIAHAHTKAIIHRDVKPSNVLGLMHDGRPTVKVIDFGIAKALTADRLTDLTYNTSQGMVVGTYEYMSPEQAAGSPDIDTRTDVYSLGVLLYEFLAGAKPFDSKTLAQAADQELRRIIREVEPPRPSTRLTSLGESATRLAALRRQQLGALARQLRNELEWIPLKAMRKERDRRYESALQLAEDVRNYIAGRPLLAGPETRRYRLKKWSSKHRAGVLTSVGVALLVVTGVGFYIHRIRAEQARTLVAKSRADRLSDFSLSMFELGSRPEQTDLSTHLWQMAERAIQRVPTEFADDPEGKSRLQDQLAVLATILGRPGIADQLFQQVMEYRRRTLGNDDPATINAISNYAYVLTQLRKLPEAEPLHKELLDQRARVLGDDHPDTIYARHQYGFILDALGRSPEAEPFLRQALEQYRRVAGPDDPDTINAVNSYAFVLQKLKRIAEAEPLFKEALDRRREVLGASHRSTIISMNNYGNVLLVQGRYGEAEPLFREGMEVGRRVLGDANALTIRCWQRRIICLKELGRTAEADQLQQQLAVVEATTRPVRPK